MTQPPDPAWLLVGILLLMAGLGLFVWVFMTNEKAKREGKRP